MKKLMLAMSAAVTCAVTQESVYCVRKLLVIALATCTAMGAFANVYYSAKGSGSGTWNGTAWAWKDASDGSAPAGLAAAGDGHTWVLIAGQKLTGNPTTLPDTTWVWGSDGREGWPEKAVYYQSCNGITYTIPTCTVYGCTMICNNKGTLTLYGDFTFINCGQDFSFYGNSTSGDERNVRFGASFKATAASDVCIKIPSKTGVGYHNHVTLQGDFSAFKGNFAVTETGADLNELLLLSETAMGDMSSPRTDAFTLGNLCKLAIGPDVVQSADRGVTFNLKADETAYIGTTGGKDTDESTVTTPLYGSVGTLVKEDAGTVAIAGPMEMKNVVVREGALKLAKTATLADDLTVTVEEGAVLYLTPDRIGKVTTTGAGEVRLDPIELEYHAKTETDPAYTTPVTLADGFDPQGATIAILLDPALPLPLNETNRLAVARIPNGKLTADDFAYENAKTCDLPTTWFETETDGTGLQTVYLVARPALAEATQKITSVNTAWSDGLGLHAGADYFNIEGVYADVYAGNARLGVGNNESDFDLSVSESFTFCNRAVYSYRRSWTMTRMRCYAGSTLGFIYATKAVDDSMYRYVFGDIEIDASATESAPFTVELSTSTGSYPDNDIRGNISGAGAMKVYSSKTSSMEAPSTLKLSGDNSGFTGRLLVTSDSTHYVLLAVTNAAALGGSPESFDADAVCLDAATSKHSVLRADASMTVDDAKRGWTVTRGTLRAAEGVTLTVNSPLLVKTLAIKDGPGTLALGGSVSVSAETDSLDVREGFLQVASPETLAGVPVTFAELTDGGISVDAASTDADYQAKGLMAKTLTFADEGVIKVAVANWTKEMSYVTRAVVTVPAGGPDLSGRLVPTRVRGATVTVLDPVVNEDGSTTYRVAIEPSGLSVILL